MRDSVGKSRKRAFSINKNNLTHGQRLRMVNISMKDGFIFKFY